MSATVNTVLARCMVDPDYLALMASDREAALRGYELDARTRADFLALDVRRLIGLATVITKVQNNGLWQWLPYTRALTVRYGIEHELFAAFQREHQLLRSGPRTRDEQTLRFLDFVRAALDEWIPEEMPGLREVFLHERILWEIRTALGSPTATGTARVPAPNGALRIGHFACSPSEVIAAIRKERFIPEDVRPVPQWLVYHGNLETNSVRTLEVDAQAARILELADGTRSVAAIARDAGCARGTARSFIGEAADAGLLTTATRSRSHARPLRR